MSFLLESMLSVVLKFVWGRLEGWIDRRIRYEQNKRILINEVKDVAKKAAERNERIAVDRESVDDSFVRLERFTVRKQSDESDEPRGC